MATTDIGDIILDPFMGSGQTAIAALNDNRRYLGYEIEPQYVRLADILSGLGKTVFFGLIIGVVGCFNGLQTRGGTEGLGQATTRTVVTSALLVFISDFFLTKFFWWLEGW